MPELHLGGVTYYGGFTHVPESKWTRIGRLVLGDDAVTMDRVQDKQMRNLPAVELCRSRAISTIEVTSEQVAKSKLGAALVFGVLGGVTAKGSMDRATIIIHLKSGAAGYLAVDKKSSASVLGLITPWAREKEIGLGAPQAQPIQSAGPKLIADELAKLAELRESGVLTEQEFLSLKRTLIEDHMGSTN